MNGATQAKIHRMYEAGFGQKAIAVEVGSTQLAVSRVVYRYRAWKAGVADSPYTNVKGPTNVKAADPTEEEIYRQAAILRSLRSGGGGHKERIGAIREITTRMILTGR